jgi:DNA polymerase III delta prime subunit
MIKIGNRLSHAYIVTGVIAESIAMAAVCSCRDGNRPCEGCTHCEKAKRHIHPDITTVGRLADKREIVVDQIRELKQDVYIMPNEAGQKAYIVNEADTMNKNAQNAFLQILEEPPANAVFILNTANPAALLPTVRSRCVELKSRSAADDVTEHVSDRDGIEEITNDFITALTDGDNVKLVKCMFRLDKLDRLAFSDFINLAREKVVLSLKGDSKTGSPDKQKTLVSADGVLIKAGDMLSLNVSAGHISGMICASLIRV